MVLATAGASRVRRPHDEPSGTNVGDVERMLSVVAGGAMALLGVRRRDLSGIGVALIGAELVRRGTTGHCVLYQTMGVSTADGRTMPKRARGELVSRAATVDARRAIKIERSVTVMRDAAEMYAMWRDFQNLPGFMPHIQEVRVKANGRSHWTAALDHGETVEWDAEIVNDIEGELIAWKTVGDPDVAHAGSVHFRPAPGGRGTEVRVVLDYEPPARTMVVRMARVFGQSPDQLVREDLRRFKMLVESGEIATTVGQSRCV